MDERAMAWEYLALGLSQSESKLNHLGRDGWELVAYTNNRAVFKRPLIRGRDGRGNHEG